MPDFRILLAIAGAAALIFGAMWFYHQGSTAQVNKDLKATTETQRRINDADASGPRTPDDVDKRLRDGKF